MMTEIWWKVFLASIITVVVAKMAGSPWGILPLVACAWLGWTAVIFLIIFISARKTKDQ